MISLYEKNASNSVSLVIEFWTRMQTNRFDSVKDLCSDSFVLDWPQTNERIRGVINFVQMNREYPTVGLWRFAVSQVVGSPDAVVTDVSISNDVICVRALTFFYIKNQKIDKMIEYWPENYTPPGNRQHLTEPIK